MVTDHDHSGLRDRVLMLRSMESLAGLDDESLSLIAEWARPRRFAPGDMLLREGEPIASVFIVMDGHVRVTRCGKLVADVRRSYGVGFLSTLARDANGVEAVAQLATYALEVPVAVLLDAYEESWPLLRNSLRLAAISVLEVRGSLPARPDELGEVSIGVRPERSRTFVERVIEMRRLPLFADCNLDAVIEMSRRSREVRGEAGDVLWEVGDSPTYYVRVDYGLMRCTAPDGGSVVTGHGQVLGTMDTLSTEPRAYRVVAETDYTILRIERETLLAVLEAHFELAMNLQAMLLRILLQGN